jgi:hypothetical protein
MSEIDISIDELVIGGVDARDAQQLGQIVTRELQRLLTQREQPLRTDHQTTVHVSVNQWQSDATPAQVGAMIAQAIYTTLV